MATTNINRKKEIPIKDLKAVFYIESGALKWKSDRSAGTKAGDIAGYPNKAGYYDVSFRKVRYYAHRIVFAMTHNRWPEGVIDHVDKNKANNDPSNLRDVTDSKNNFNQKIKSLNTSGAVGVSSHSGGWSGEVRAYGVRYRKWFKEFEDAASWVEKTRKRVQK